MNQPSAPVPDLMGALATVLGVDVADLPKPPPWNDAEEDRIAQVANTIDEETGRSQPLPRDRRWDR